MTNKEAFMSYYPDSPRAGLILDIKGIDPNLSDNVAVSAAWGMVEALTNADYSQGRTSEKLSASARRELKQKAKEIFKANGITWDDGSIPRITSVRW